MTQKDTNQASTTAKAGALGRGLRPLLIGIRRRIYKLRENKVTPPEEAFKQASKLALDRAGHRCVFCGFRSQKINDVYHLDDNPNNNNPENLACVCQLCHPYLRIGAVSKTGLAVGLEAGHIGNNAQLMRVPDAEEISAQDMNHLLRAISIGLSDESEREMAAKIYGMLANKEVFNEMSEVFKTCKDQDMGMALKGLTDDEYNRRETMLDAVRVMYNPKLLKDWGMGLKSEHSALSNPSEWPRLMEKQMETLFPPEPEPDPGMMTVAGGGASMMDDSIGISSLPQHPGEDDDDYEEGDDD